MITQMFAVFLLYFLSNSLLLLSPKIQPTQPKIMSQNVSNHFYFYIYLYFCISRRQRFMCVNAKWLQK